MSAEMTLPEGWIDTKFTDFLDVQGGTQPPKSNFIYEPTEGYIRLLQIRDFGEKPVPTYIPEKKTLKTCQMDDVLIGRYGASLGRICSGMTGAYNVALAKVIAPSCFPLRYLKHYLNSSLFQLPLALLSRSAQNGFNKEDLATFPFPIPPLAEQHQIAQILDELLAQVDTIKARLDAIPAILKRFRQSVLSAAVSGKLTEEWRASNGLQKQWEISTLESIVSNIVDCPHSTPKWTEQGKYCVRTTAFKPFKLDLSNQGFVSEEVYLDRIKRLKPKSEDILYSREGTVGIACQIPPNIDLCLGQRMILIRTSERLLAKFLTMVLNSEQILSIVRHLTLGSTAPRINISDIRNFLIPNPTLEEQHEIVRRVDKLFLFTEQIEQRVNDAKARVDKLTQSILAKAFRGELTADWRTEHPELISGENSAEALLAKIQAAKAALDGKKKKGKAA